MKKDKSHLGEYFNWLLKTKYEEIQKKLDHSVWYRIINITKNALNEYLVVVCILNTGEEVQYRVHEIASDDALLECFSKNDVRIITFYACKDIKTPTRQITEALLSNNLTDVIFSVQEKNSLNVVKKTANEISSDRELLSSLSPQDAHRVGYVYGASSVASESEEQKKLGNVVELYTE